MNLHETLLAFSSLFVIVDPIGVVPVFLAMTPTDSPRARIRMARLACAVAGVCLLLFAVVGRGLISLLGVGMPAIRMAGSLVLVLVALDMLRAHRSAVQQTAEETEAGTAKDDIAVTPLAIPLLAGPGAIATVILLADRATTLGGHLTLYACIVAVAAVSYVTLHLAARAGRWLSPIATKVSTRIMGLLLAAVAFQFMFDALRQAGVIR